MEGYIKSESRTQSVFSYGTLTEKFYEAPREDAWLTGAFEIKHGMYPELRRSKNLNYIHGVVLELNEAQLIEADRYESDLYKREILTLHTDLGDIDAWVYLAV